jgi:hypothetical protein
MASIKRTRYALPTVLGGDRQRWHAMQDLVRDWRRWTRSERVAAAAIAVIILLGVPAALAIGG